jgi:acetyl esterase
LVIVIVSVSELSSHANEDHKIDPKVQQFLDKLALSDGPPLYTLSPVDARKVLNKLQTPTIAFPDVEIQDVMLPVGPRGHVSVRILRPTNNNSPLPIVMYFHGGGWVMGNKYTHDHLIRQLAVGAQVAIIFVEYTPSPEAQYPIPIQEAYAATKYVIDHAKQFNLNSSWIGVVGDSVGGNMATIVAMLYNNAKNVHKISVQLLFYPVTNANF